MIGIHELIRMTVATEKPDLNKALEVVRNTPGWEQKVREWFKQDKKAGLGKGLAIPLTVALLTLSQAWGADTADQFISKVKDQAGIEKVVSKPDSVLVDTLAKMLPHPVTGSELDKIKSGLVPRFLFDMSLKGKIKESLKEILPEIKSDPSLSVLDTTTLSRLIAKALIVKINDSTHAEDKKIIMNYLGKDGLKIIEDMARTTVSEALPTTRRIKDDRRHQA